MPDEDPGKKIPQNQRPLTCKKSFINPKTTQAFGSEQRKTIFGGEFAHYYAPGFERDGSYAGAKVGPGPATRNLYENELHAMKTSSNKTTLP